MELTKPEKSREEINEEIAKRVVNKPAAKWREVCDHLKAVLEANRVRSIAGWKRDRCSACNHPHPVFKHCECPHHAALAFLRENGFEVEA